MSPHNLAEHFARLQQLYKEYGITTGAQIFNLEESGFSTRTAFRARGKAAMDRQGRSNSTELKWAGNAAHVTIMPVVSADGTVWTPVAILYGKRAKYRIREDSARETPASYLRGNVKVAYRDPAGMDSAIFFEFCQNFVLETASLRRRHKNSVLTMDGYGAHTTYKALQYLRDNNIHVIALPAHTSHRTQTLDYSVFSPFKTYLRNAMNERSLASAAEVRNDIYTLCELLHAAYRKSVTYTNIMNGFKGCGVWCAIRKTAISDVICLGDTTNRDGYESREAAFAAFKDLVASYASTRNLLRSDGPMSDSGTLNTRAGALSTTDDVLETRRKREEARALEQEQRNALQAEVPSRRAAREQEAADRVRLRNDAQRAQHNHTTWLVQRAVREVACTAGCTRGGLVWNLEDTGGGSHENVHWGHQGYSENLI